MTAGALFRNVLVCAVLLSGGAIAQAVVVGPDNPSTAPRQVGAVMTPSAGAVTPLMDLAQARAAQSAVSVPLTPALMLLATALASLLGLRGLRRRS